MEIEYHFQALGDQKHGKTVGCSLWGNCVNSSGSWLLNNMQGVHAPEDPSQRSIACVDFSSGTFLLGSVKIYQVEVSQGLNYGLSQELLSTA